MCLLPQRRTTPRAPPFARCVASTLATVNPRQFKPQSVVLLSSMFSRPLRRQLVKCALKLRYISHHSS